MNPFRLMLQAHGARAPIGTWIVSASPIVAEAVGHSGFDWGVLDMEHTPLDLMVLVNLLQAVGNTRMLPVVRVPANEPVAIKRVLDAGAQTLLVPCVQCAEDAARAVAATRHPPEGVRSMTAMSRAARYGTVPDHFRAANRSIGVVVQLESGPALARLEEIAAVPGVDALFVGPADLSGSMGHGGDPMHPAVFAAMAKAAERARAVGKPIGTLGSTPEVVTRYRAAGYDFVAVASDLGLLMRGAHAAVQSLRAADTRPQVHTLADGTRTESAGG
ncbi:MAG: 2-dehydro-3-deoxyglucarate aldolase [Burkholderiales bacterium]|nr:2-dehydro-3-deoxyglucarate aldolase [Burkholderiales bacterium]